MNKDILNVNMFHFRVLKIRTYNVQKWGAIKFKQSNATKGYEMQVLWQVL